MSDFIHPEFLTMSIRLLLALVLSGIIGFEREINKHSAGFRTHILVGVSSCLMMLLSLYGFEEYTNNFAGEVRFDPARIPSYVISGIGFLGAGTIIVTGVTVKGLTTAASIWAVAGLGLVVGIGMIDIAILTTIIIFFSLFFLNNIERIISKRGRRRKLEIIVTDLSIVDQIFIHFNSHDVTVRNFHLEKDQSDGSDGAVIIIADISIGKDTVLNDVCYDLLEIDQIKQVKEVEQV